MYAKLEVIANARADSLKRLGADRFQISVKEPPVRNLANKRVLELLARHLGIDSKQIRIINGHFHPHKLVHIRRV